MLCCSAHDIVCSSKPLQPTTRLLNDRRLALETSSHSITPARSPWPGSTMSPSTRITACWQSVCLRMELHRGMMKSREVYAEFTPATTRGLRVYTTDPFELTNHSYEEDISLVEQLFSTSLVAMILTPRLLRIVNTKVRGVSTARTFIPRDLTRLSSESRNTPQFASSPSTAWWWRSR